MSPASSSIRRRSATAAAALVCAMAVGGIAAPAQAVDAGPGSALTAGVFQEFTSADDLTLEYHYFENGDNGTLFYFDGDGTTNFHYPEVDADVYHEPGVGNGHVQRMNAEAAERGMNLVFLEHPDGHVGNSSWWTGADIAAYTPAVQELITATGDPNVQLAGYSGGAEFIVLWLLIDGTDWLPENSRAAMIGGGGSYGYPIVPPSADRAGMGITWYVGEHDREGATEPPEWSAWDAAHDGHAELSQAGYTNTAFVEIPDTTHLNYDFRSIVGTELDELLASSSSEDEPDEEQPASTELTPDVFQEFTGTNGKMLQYHYFDNGDNGTLFYFDGDETTNFHYPLVDASVVHEPGVGNGHVQRMNLEAAERGMDLVFLEHPHGEDVEPGETRTTGTSWWNYMTDEEVNAFADVVQEIIDASDAERVQMVGYSGGSEFLVRHLLLDGNGWLPQQSAAAMIGGGGLAGYPLQAPAEGMEQMSYMWLVGELDGPDVENTAVWSALRVSRNAVASFQGLGYAGADIIEIPETDHYNYDFAGLVGDRLDALVAADDSDDNTPGDPTDSDEPESPAIDETVDGNSNETEGDALPKTGFGALSTGIAVSVALMLAGFLALFGRGMVGRSVLDRKRHS